MYLLLPLLKLKLFKQEYHRIQNEILNLADTQGYKSPKGSGDYSPIGGEEAPAGNKPPPGLVLPRQRDGDEDKYQRNAGDALEDVQVAREQQRAIGEATARVKRVVAKSWKPRLIKAAVGVLIALAGAITTYFSASRAAKCSPCSTNRIANRRDCLNPIMTSSI